jgi:hypothetical protein
MGIFYCTWSIETYTTKSVRIMVCIGYLLFYFCFLNFMLPACKTEFCRSCWHHIKGSADLMQMNFRIQRVNCSRGRLWDTIQLFRLAERLCHEITTQNVECSAVYLITGAEFPWPVCRLDGLAAAVSITRGQVVSGRTASLLLGRQASASV